MKKERTALLGKAGWATTLGLPAVSTSAKRALFWAPRILSILFGLFLSLFALDVFDLGLGPGEIIVALLMHLVPVFVVTIALVTAWKWEWVGAVLFAALAVFYVVWTRGKFHWSAYLAISGPLLVINALFLFNWIYRAQLRAE